MKLKFLTVSPLYVLFLQTFWMLWSHTQNTHTHTHTHKTHTHLHRHTHTLVFVAVDSSI